MKSRLGLSSLMLLLLTGPVFALCTTGSTATCSINGKAGTRTCLGSGRFSPCVASPQTSPTGPASLPANYIGEANDSKGANAPRSGPWSEAASRYNAKHNI
jgi:hypothetical protein